MTNRKRFLTYIVRNSFYQRVIVALIGAAINMEEIDNLDD